MAWTLIVITTLLTPASYTPNHAVTFATFSTEAQCKNARDIIAQRAPSTFTQCLSTP